MLKLRNIGKKNVPLQRVHGRMMVNQENSLKMDVLPNGNVMMEVMVHGLFTILWMILIQQSVHLQVLMNVKHRLMDFVGTKGLTLKVSATIGIQDAINTINKI